MFRPTWKMAIKMAWHVCNSYPAMKAETAADIQKHPYSPKLDNDRRTASDIQQTDGMLMTICQFHKHISD